MRVLKYIINIAIPAISTYFASDDTLIKWKKKKNILSGTINTLLFQKICLLISVIFTTFILNIKLIISSCTNERHQKEIAGLYNVIKQFAQSNFASITNNNNFSFDLRIFVPEVNISKTVLAFVTRKKAEKWFIIRNIEPFAKKDITEHLRFRVEPDIQGLVGEAYKSGFIVYDETLEITNNTKYSLDKAQLSRTSKLLWSLCVPILNDNNEVFAVMAFDSDSSPLDISSNKEEIRALTNTLAIMMRDSVPELFKREWRII